MSIEEINTKLNTALRRLAKLEARVGIEKPKRVRKSTYKPKVKGQLTSKEAIYKYMDERLLKRFGKKSETTNPPARRQKQAAGLRGNGLSL